MAVLALLLAAAPGTRAAQTETWEPLVTTQGTRAFDVEYELWYYVNVVFESEVEATADGYEYRYRLTNKGDTQVRVEWRGLEESAFGEEVDDVEELRMGLIEPDTVTDWLVLTSSVPPQVIERPARMFGSAPSGNEAVQFAGLAPVYVPAAEELTASVPAALPGSTRLRGKRPASQRRFLPEFQTANDGVFKPVRKPGGGFVA